MPVSIVVVAMLENAVRGRYAKLRVDDLETVDDHSVGSGLDPKADQFKKTGVCHRTLIHVGRTAATDAVSGAGVGIAVLCQSYLVG